MFRLLSGCAALRRPDGSPVDARPRERAIRRERIATPGGALASTLCHLLVILIAPAVTIPAIGLRPDDALADPPMRVVRVHELDPREPAPVRTETVAHPVLALEPPAIARTVAGPSPGGLDVTRIAVAAPDVAIVTRAPSFDAGRPDVYVRPVALSILTSWRPTVPPGGVETTIRVHIDAGGRATGLVELVPPTRSVRLNEDILSRVRLLEFQPALRGGAPIASWAEITLVICPHGVTATSPASPSGRAVPCADSIRAVPVGKQGS